jgi:ribosomal protein S26
MNLKSEKSPIFKIIDQEKRVSRTCVAAIILRRVVLDLENDSFIFTSFTLKNTNFFVIYITCSVFAIRIKNIIMQLSQKYHY